MLILRLLLILSALLIAVSGSAYFVTGDPRYMRFAWQVVRFVLYVLLVLALVFVLERYALTGWRVIF